MMNEMMKTIAVELVVMAVLWVACQIIVHIIHIVYIDHIDCEDEDDDVLSDIGPSMT